MIVTHSSGNHAQAVALAASLSGFKAHVVMPKGSLKVKKQAVLDYGAQVSVCENYEKVRLILCTINSNIIMSVYY